MELRSVLRDDPAEVGHARRLLASYLDGCGFADPDQIATLLVSELVTNALLHGHPPLELIVRDILTGVRVEVHDSNPAGTPSMREDGAGMQSGRGLLLVDQLANRWGWAESNRGPGKCVWFEVDLVWPSTLNGRGREPSDLMNRIRDVEAEGLQRDAGPAAIERGTEATGRQRDTR